MPVRIIPKAATFGKSKKWQTNFNFLTQIQNEFVKKQNQDYPPSYGDIDIIIEILAENNFCIMAEAGAAKLVA